MKDYTEALGSSKRKPSPEYIQFLEKIFLASACDRRALYDGLTSPQNIRSFIKRAIENGHIADYSYKEIYGRRNRQHSFISITAKGVACLSFFGTQPWCKFLPSDPTLSIIKKDYRGDSLAYASRCGNIFILMKNLGATYSDFILSGEPSDTSWLVPKNREFEPYGDDEEDEEIYNLASDDYESSLYDIGVMQDSESEEKLPPEGITLERIKCEAYTIMRMVVDSSRTIEKGNLYFFPVREIRKMLIRDGTGNFDFSYGQYMGAVFSEKVGLVLYHAKHDGISWARGADHRDIKIMQQFSGRYSPYNTIMKSQAFAGIVVYNEKNFADLVMNKFGKRKTGVVMGKDYNIIHALPLSHYSTEFLSRWVLPMTPAERRKYIHEGIAELYELRYVTDANTRKSIAYQGDIGLVADGTNMDVIQCMAQYKMYCEGALDKLTIICFPWQETFYEKLWSNIITLQFITAAYPRALTDSGDSQP